MTEVKEAECGECCKPHLSLTLSDQPEKWCPNYCCFHASNLYGGDESTVDYSHMFKWEYTFICSSNNHLKDIQ
ncbi:hypothetical protein KUTeg_024867, partial [Tegillarca granosa]